MDYWKKLTKHYGTQAAAARALNVSPQVVSDWRKKGRPPLEAQVHWEVDSLGKVRAVDLPAYFRKQAA